MKKIQSAIAGSALLFFSIIGISEKLFSQTISLYGSNYVSLAAQETYYASFGYSLDPSTSLEWSVSGGTIIDQVTDPTAQSIYCTVHWNNYPGTGLISLRENYGGYGERSVQIGTMTDQIIAPLGTFNNINCSSIASSSCNLISNNNFTPTTPYNPYDPFTEGSVPYWASSHGSPQIQDGFYPSLQPPSPATGFAYMYSWTNGNGGSEGIAQKIPNLIQGHTYQLSFYMRFSYWTSFPYAANQLDNLYAAFITCSDFNSLQGGSTTPPFPSNHQIAYHGTSLTNQTWVLVQVSFTANDNYDIIWIFPDQTISGIAGVDIAYPILTEGSSSLSISPAGPIDQCYPYEIPSTITLTASQASSYQWYKNLSPISGATSQTLNVGSSGLGNGDYTVTSGSCPSANSVTIHFKPWTGTITPTYCYSCTPSSYCLGKPGGLRQLSPFVQNTTYAWTVTPSTGVTIVQNNPTDYFATLTFPSNYSSTTATIGITMNEDGCINSTSYTVNVGPNGSIFQTYNNACYNQQPFIVHANTSTADYDEWDFGPGATVQSTGTQYYTCTAVGFNHDDIYVSYSTPGTKYAIVRRYDNNIYHDCDTKTVQINVDGTCRPGNSSIVPTNIQEQSKSLEKIILYPNPSKTEVSIFSFNRIDKIEIYNLKGQMLKQRQGINQTQLTLNTADLSNGVYVIKIWANNKQQTIKLIVQH